MCRERPRNRVAVFEPNRRTFTARLTPGRDSFAGRALLKSQQHCNLRYHALPAMHTEHQPAALWEHNIPVALGGGKSGFFLSRASRTLFFRSRALSPWIGCSVHIFPIFSNGSCVCVCAVRVCCGSGFSHLEQLGVGNRHRICSPLWLSHTFRSRNDAGHFLPAY